MRIESRWDVMYLDDGTERKIQGSDVRKRLWMWERQRIYVRSLLA
jgi:hypothetical protein